MADKKISALTGAITPLAGTEVLPIVQGSATVKVSVANLTAGRAVAMAGGSFTDDITQSTAAKGINFTANTPAAGKTSQLLNWYEEGTWTPTMTSASGTLTVTASSGTYTRIGRFVQFCCSVTFDTNASVGTSDLTIGGLPFTVASGRPSFGNFVSTNFSLGDYGTGGAQGLVSVSGGTTAFSHLARTIVINSRTGCAWAYAGVYQV